MLCTPVLYRCAKGVLTQVVRHAFPLPPPCLVAVLPHHPPLALHGSVRGAQSHPLRASCSPPFPSSFIICHFCSLKRSYSSEQWRCEGGPPATNSCNILTPAPVPPVVMSESLPASHCDSQTQKCFTNICVCHSLRRCFTYTKIFLAQSKFCSQVDQWNKKHLAF